MTEESVNMRREDILSTPNPARRATVLAIHNLAVSQPRLAARMLGVPYSEHGWEHIGSGVDSTVFKISDEEVLKVNRRSVESSPSARQEFIDRAHEEHGKLRQVLGHFVVPHNSMQVGSHPVVPTVNIVEIRQPYMHISDPKLLHPAVIETVTEKIIDMRSSGVAIDEQLGDYIERSRFLYSMHGLLPDICGTANLVLVDGSDIRQVDGMPIGREHPQTQQAINGYLDMMESAIAVAA
jgi:hypothetical protein